ncbi:MAG: DUF86 domain-containing protein [Candidatus Micrarchaeota archaeon]|nr:DUF86 domain-containing protein [Candidatus Micrarchaeota archaeon]
MNKNPSLYLGHILEAVKKISRYTSGIDEEEFLENELVKDGVTCNIQIIGEAIKNLPPEFKEKHPEVPWKDIAGMRDRIVHFYFGIDYQIMWATVKEDIPELQQQIKKLLKGQ